MKIFTSTEVRQNFSTVISGLKDSPVIISKQDKEVAVMLSTVRYKELKKWKIFSMKKWQNRRYKKGLRQT